jgi:hypothetical protein
MSWILQILGHQLFEKNTPAFMDNLYDSFLFAPYFVFLEIFYSNAFNETPSYTIIQNEFTCRPTILYFAGLFQKADKEYKKIAEQLYEHNHIFINVHFKQNDVFSSILENMINELPNTNIDCIVGYSFGGSLAKQMKDIYYKKTGKDIPAILISPGGFLSDTLFEKTIRYISPVCYWLYQTDKWYMITQYPLYQNTVKESDTDVFIVSTNDTVHFPKIGKNQLTVENISHSNIRMYVEKQKIM